MWMDETISSESLDFETSDDLVSDTSTIGRPLPSLEGLTRLDYKIPGELASRLDKASRNEGVAASNYLLAAFSVVLGRYVQD
ncbi:MAG: hypothetical protein RLZZ396_1924 [Planctomycetota bacterium]|jgi:hypothetical protein